MDEFNFKYIPEVELTKIVKEVKRERRKKLEEKEWEDYLEKRNHKLPPKQNDPRYSNRPCTANNYDFHSNELLKLNEMLPEGSKFSLASIACDYKNLQQPFTITDRKPSNNCKQNRINNNESEDDDESLTLKLHKLDMLRIFNSPSLTDVNHHRRHGHNDNNFKPNRSTAAGSAEKSIYSQLCRADDCNVTSKIRRTTSMNIGDSLTSHPKCKHDFSNLQLCKLMDHCSDHGYGEIPKVDNQILPENHKYKPATNNINNTKRAQSHSYLSNEHERDFDEYDNDIMVNENGSIPRAINDHANLQQCLSMNQINDCNLPLNRFMLDIIEEEEVNGNEVDSNFSNSIDYINEPPALKSAPLGTSNTQIVDAYVPITNDCLLKSNHQLPTNQVFVDEGSKVRIDKLKSRILTALNKMLEICNKPVNLADDDIDAERKVKRANEFVSRFSRNYLYQLRRQVETVKKLNLSTCPSQTFYQKIFISYQISLQALQVISRKAGLNSLEALLSKMRSVVVYLAFVSEYIKYGYQHARPSEKHLLSTLQMAPSLHSPQTCQNFLPDTSKLSSDKLVEFIELFLSLLEFCESNLGDDNEENNEIKHLCTELILMLKSIVKNPISMTTSNNSGNNFSSSHNKNDHGTTSARQKAAKKRRRCSKKLSMYCSDSVLNWRKTSTALAKRKFGSPSRKLSSDLDKIEKKFENDKNKMNANSAKELENGKLHVVPNNINCLPKNTESSLFLNPPTEIRTFVERCAIDADDDNLELPVDNEERTKIYLLFDKLSEMISHGNKEREEMELQTREFKENKDNDTEKEKVEKISKEEIKQVLQQIQEMYLHTESLGLTRNSLDEKCPIQKSVSKRFAHGNDVGRNEQRKSKHPKNVKLTNITYNEDEHKVKIPIVELHASDKQYQSILKYRNKFFDYKKTSPIYEQFDERWAIVKRIGDNLLSNIISGVSKELQINQLIQKMYDLEFIEHYNTP